MGLNLLDIAKWGLVQLSPAKKKALDYVVAEDGISVASRLPQLLRNAGRPIRLHVYGNSLDQEDRFWRTVCAVSGGAVQLLQNSGVGGYTSGQVLAKMQAEGINTLADVVSIGEGTNDALNSVPVATSMANFAAMVSIIRAAGKVPLLRLPPPNDNSWNNRVLANWTAQLVLAEQLGIYAWDAYAKYCDTDGTWVVGFSDNGNTHPTAQNYSLAAAEGWTMLSSLARPYWLPRSNGGQGLVGSNVLQLTDSGAPAGMPTGWETLNSIPTATWAALANYNYPWRGKKASVAISQSTNASVYKQIALSAAVSIGDKVRLTGVFGCNTMSNANAVVYLRCAGVNVDTYAAYTSNTLPDSYVSCDVTIPAGTTSLQIWIRALPTTAGAMTATLEFGCMDIYNITKNKFVS